MTQKIKQTMESQSQEKTQTSPNIQINYHRSKFTYQAEGRYSGGRETVSPNEICMEYL